MMFYVCDLSPADMKCNKGRLSTTKLFVLFLKNDICQLSQHKLSNSKLEELIQIPLRDVHCMCVRLVIFTYSVGYEFMLNTESISVVSESFNSLYCTSSRSMYIPNKLRS